MHTAAVFVEKSVKNKMFSPPPGGTPVFRRNVKPYRLAPIQREMFIQEAIGDSPFYSSSAISPVRSCVGRNQAGSVTSSIPMLIMTDDGGDDWEVLSEVKLDFFK